MYASLSTVPSEVRRDLSQGFGEYTGMSDMDGLDS